MGAFLRQLCAIINDQNSLNCWTLLYEKEEKRIVNEYYTGWFFEDTKTRVLLDDLKDIGMRWFFKTTTW